MWNVGGAVACEVPAVPFSWFSSSISQCRARCIPLGCILQRWRLSHCQIGSNWTETFLYLAWTQPCRLGCHEGSCTKHPYVFHSTHTKVAVAKPYHRHRSHRRCRSYRSCGQLRRTSFPRAFRPVYLQGLMVKVETSVDVSISSKDVIAYFICNKDQDEVAGEFALVASG